MARCLHSDQLYASGTTDSVGSKSHVAYLSGYVTWDLGGGGRDQGDAASRAWSRSLTRSGVCECIPAINTGDMTGANGYDAASRRGGRAAEGIRLLSG